MKLHNLFEMDDNLRKQQRRGAIDPTEQYKAGAQRNRIDPPDPKLNLHLNLVLKALGVQYSELPTYSTHATAWNPGRFRVQVDGFPENAVQLLTKLGDVSPNNVPRIQGLNGFSVVLHYAPDDGSRDEWNTYTSINVSFIDETFDRRAGDNPTIPPGKQIAVTMAGGHDISQETYLFNLGKL